ncbi:DgyrCDS12730 [Dimorphilus gyrociliatus]|uniref:DgyrCDS12730 n=1 Tax=Dimorphilus gyrociliatus TaxID=2664684 RepID=A0A7I8W7D0_9ANNE|nr:DgyrCDS12730 [Dimorphilus gyrociliatus]
MDQDNVTSCQDKSNIIERPRLIEDKPRPSWYIPLSSKQLSAFYELLIYLDNGNSDPRVIIRKLRDVPGLKVDYGTLLQSLRRSRNERYKYIDFDRLLWSIGIFSYYDFPLALASKSAKLLASSIATFAIRGLLEESRDKNNSSKLNISEKVTVRDLRRLALSGRIASKLPNLDCFVDLMKEIALGNNLFYSSKKTRNLTTSLTENSCNCNNRLPIIDVSKLSLAYRSRPPTFAKYIPLEKCPVKRYPQPKFMNYEYFKAKLLKQMKRKIDRYYTDLKNANIKIRPKLFKWIVENRMGSNANWDNINELAHIFNIYFPNKKSDMFVQYPPDNQYGRVLQAKLKAVRREKRVYF